MMPHRSDNVRWTGVAGRAPNRVAPCLWRQDRDKAPVYDLFDADAPVKIPPGSAVRKRKRWTRRQILSRSILLFLALFWTVRIVQSHALKSWVALGCKQKEQCEPWEVGPGEPFPMLCTFCGQKDAYPAVRCASCQKLRLLADLYDTSVCPHCKETRLVEYILKRCEKCRERYVGDSHQCATSGG